MPNANDRPVYAVPGCLQEPRTPDDAWTKAAATLPGLEGIRMRAIVKSAVLGIFGLIGVVLAACSQGGAAQSASEDVSQSSELLGGCDQCHNCVDYARCRQRALPHGLFSYRDKLNIINSQVAVPGAVAIIDVGDSTGHVAYVESVNGDMITISEGNYPYGRCGTRTNTRERLRIKGYFVP